MVLLAYFWRAYSVLPKLGGPLSMAASIIIMAANKEVAHIQEVQIEKQAVEHACMAHFLHAYLALRLKTLHHIQIPCQWVWWGYRKSRKFFSI